MPINNIDLPHEWSYAQDDLGIVYCLGRSVGATHHEVVATYYQTDEEHATKQTLDADRHYRRFVYQGLPEEREHLEGVKRSEVVERLLSHTASTGVGIVLDRTTLMFGDVRYREAKAWLANRLPAARRFQQALQVAAGALAGVGVAIDELYLYGGASFGVVNNTNKVVDDVDFVFRPVNLSQLRAAIDVLGSSYTWNEIDPFGRLPKERQLLKAKRWSTSQIRLAEPYPLSIDLKIARLPGEISLWDAVPDYDETQSFIDDVKVIDDSEALCTSPAFRCEDTGGNERIVLMDGYQYIGCAVKGDVMSVRGVAYRDSNVIRVAQSAADSVTPDFRTVPIE